MSTNNPGPIQAAEVVLPCAELDSTLAFFLDTLGFRVEAVFPADAPEVAVIAGHGLRLRLQRGVAEAPCRLRLACLDPAAVAGGERELCAPNGTRIELVEAAPPLVLPPAQPSFVLSRANDDSPWGVGRAGMQYRDLVPGRQGGRFIASHIRIPGGGPVPDYVHFHRVRFQMIYCLAGWVRVVYEDQGPPLVMQAGDCVLQPPQIRHRVLESSPGLEVLEVGCPAEHETWADHDLELPTPSIRPERDFSGQRFVLHRAAQAEWRPWRLAGFEYRDTGIARATDGLARVEVARPTGTPTGTAAGGLWSHDAEFLFLFVLRGAVTLEREERGSERLSTGDACVVPPSVRQAFVDVSPDLELLEIELPATASL